ncbi:phosphoadenosine phosphosulfate reductase family protein [Jutongia sp.]|uniref:phosphoadenosine phosphosulfate reductase domain-containing protein n=1 Tax=Jutongia sp. TaxID=2944204 RepID=UPI003080FFC4
MREYVCPKHMCRVANKKCMEWSIDDTTGQRIQCTEKPIISTTIYWCKKCNVPIYERCCTACGGKGEYIATDIRPVFPEEKVLLAILLKKENPLCFEKSSIWNNMNHYFIDGIKIQVSFKEFNSKTLDEIKDIKKRYDKYLNKINYAEYDKIVGKFVKANENRYSEITDEAISFIQRYKDIYSLNDMFVSFSGGKDSTVTSDIVRRAFSSNKIYHIFGDTTLEFPLTYEYKERFTKEHRVLVAKNYEKEFETLCKQIGPPSRVMRWCCTVFKTGAITQTITSAFKNKTDILSFQGIRHNESLSRSKYDRESKSPKITKQTVVAPIIEWSDFDVWLYILTTGIDFNNAYRLGYSRVGCWCCPNNGSWSEFLSKVHMYKQYIHWREILIEFAKRIDKRDPEEYVDEGGWKARQGGNGIDIAERSVISYEPCATEDNTFNYELQRPITKELYELFKPFGYINFQLGNERLGEVYVLDKQGNVVLVLKGRIGSTKLKITIKNERLAGAKSLKVAEGKIQCQLTKYQMCINCKACESVCKFSAIKIKELDDGSVSYKIEDKRCKRCTECVNHFNAGCYVRKVLTIKRDG